MGKYPHTHAPPPPCTIQKKIVTLLVNSITSQSNSNTPNSRDARLVRPLDRKTEKIRINPQIVFCVAKSRIKNKKDINLRKKIIASDKFP